MIKIENNVYFDTDCLSAFLWVNEMASLAILFKNNIILPREVYKELCCVPHFIPILNNYISKKVLKIVDIGYGTNEMKIYQTIMYSDPHNKVFGKGEAEVLSHAICNSKEMASNNLSDVQAYVEKYKLLNHTVPEILEMLVENNIKTPAEIEVMWINIKQKGFKIPGDSFSEYLTRYKYHK